MLIFPERVENGWSRRIIASCGLSAVGAQGGELQSLIAGKRLLKSKATIMSVGGARRIRQHSVGDIDQVLAHGCRLLLHFSEIVLSDSKRTALKLFRGGR